MTLSLNKPKLDKPAADIWKSAERLRGKFKSYEYQSVILPIIVPTSFSTTPAFSTTSGCCATTSPPVTRAA